MDLLDRYRGCLLGLAVGDALGRTLEFMLPGTFPPLTDMPAEAPFGMKQEGGTDDTALAICLAESLVARKGRLAAADLLDRYLGWYRKHYLPSTGQYVDQKMLVRSAYERFERPQDPTSGPNPPDPASSAFLARLAPVVLAHARRPIPALARAADYARLLEGNAVAVDGCRYLAGLLLGALAGVPKASLLTPNYSPRPGGAAPFGPEIAPVAGGSFLEREPPAIRNGAQAPAALEAALWAFARTDSFGDGALLVVNLGDDADTTGAIYGQLAGACYGESAIPDAWRARLTYRPLLTELAGRLHTLAAKT